MLVDWGATGRPYKSDLTRVLVTGKVTPEVREDLSDRPGGPGAGDRRDPAGREGPDVDAEARSVIEEAGFGRFFDHGLGHGLGMDIHEAPRLRKDSDVHAPAGHGRHGRAGHLPARLGRDPDRGRRAGDPRRLRGPLDVCRSRSTRSGLLSRTRSSTRRPAAGPVIGVGSRASRTHEQTGREASIAMRSEGMAENAPETNEPLDVSRIQYLVRLMKRYDLTDSTSSTAPTRSASGGGGRSRDPAAASSRRAGRRWPPRPRVASGRRLRRPEPARRARRAPGTS